MSDVWWTVAGAVGAIVGIAIGKAWNTWRHPLPPPLDAPGPVSMEPPQVYGLLDELEQRRQRGKP